MQFWVPVVSKWTAQKAYKTLADVPEKVRCLVYFKSAPDCLVRARIGNFAARCTRDGGFTLQDDLASNYSVQKILDPIPDPPALTLDDLPDGRCIQFIPGDWIYWKHKGVLISSNGAAIVHPCRGFSDGKTPFTILDLEMQLQDVLVTVSK